MKSKEEKEVEKQPLSRSVTQFSVLSLNSGYFGLWQGVTGRKVGRGRCVGQG